MKQEDLGVKTRKEVTEGGKILLYYIVSSCIILYHIVNRHIVLMGWRVNLFALKVTAIVICIVTLD